MAYTGRDSKISNVIWSPFATSLATRSASWNPSSTSGSSAGAPLRRGPYTCFSKLCLSPTPHQAVAGSRGR